jgi:sulfate transport system permease protein
LPGFGISFGFTTLYLIAVVLIPLAALLIRPLDLGLDGFWRVVSAPRVLAALKLSFGAAAAAAAVNSVFGFVLAWVLTRYRFRGDGLVNALVDLPFALPTAVAGIALSALYANGGWIGGPLARAGLTVAFTPWGVVVALIFIGLPFVVRTLEPVLADLSRESEEAAATLGASRLQTFLRVVAPALAPTVISGTAMAFARAVGEYGSVIFIAGNLPRRSEIAPLLIVVKLQEYDYAGAAAIGVVMLGASFVFLLALNGVRGVMGRRR